MFRDEAFKGLPPPLQLSLMKQEVVEAGVTLTETCPLASQNLPEPTGLGRQLLGFPDLVSDKSQVPPADVPQRGADVGLCQDGLQKHYPGTSHQSFPGSREPKGHLKLVLSYRCT